MNPVLAAVTLLLLIGAAILWRRTHRTSALLQLIGCSVLFVFVGLEQPGQFLLARKSQDSSAGGNQLLAGRGPQSQFGCAYYHAEALTDAIKVEFRFDIIPVCSDKRFGVVATR